jgi:electron transfer flavoprotein alpha subunit
VGADEAVAESGGCCWLVGSGCADALAEFETSIEHATLVEIGPGPMIDRFRRALGAALVERTPVGAHVILPSSPDGRDLAPHLAAELGRPLVAGATEVTAAFAVVARQGGHTMETVALDGPVVATLQPGSREVPPAPEVGRRATVDTLDVASHDPAVEEAALVGAAVSGANEVELIEEVPADPATMDLADAPRIVAGGAGLGAPESFEGLYTIADALGASVGATRVVTDQGWISVERQIGTTGVTVDPDLYVAVGISGAVQHTAGLGSPDHMIVVNTDPSCPMMELADVGIVCDGPAFVDELAAALEAFSRTPANPANRREPDLEA